MANLTQKVAFIDKIGKIVKAEVDKRGYGTAQLHTAIVMACLESAWGLSTMMKKSNAVFGIKATKSWTGKVYNATTKECYNGKDLEEVNGCFRAYDTLEESIADYFDLLETKRYKDCLSVDTLVECITIIKNGGYATAPSYISNIINTFNTNKRYIAVYVATKTVTEESIRHAINIDILAKNVIAGKYGNGLARKQALGTDYSAVQKRVNELLKED